ncbi:SLC13 family permease [Nonomuraea dietziae]|uniref:SLC13 family permease n=1 Tax=Nonomuraea dietziae TaxID=65515 RepID=UPI0031D654B7
MLLIAPVTFPGLRARLALPVAPYLIAEAMAANIGGTATLVGDPPNIIIASRGGLSFNDFLVHLAPLVVVLLVIFIGLCRFLFRGSFACTPSARRAHRESWRSTSARPVRANREAAVGSSLGWASTLVMPSVLRAPTHCCTTKAHVVALLARGTRAGGRPPGGHQRVRPSPSRVPDIAGLTSRG